MANLRKSTSSSTTSTSSSSNSSNSSSSSGSESSSSDSESSSSQESTRSNSNATSSTHQKVTTRSVDDHRNRTVKNKPVKEPSNTTSSTIATPSARNPIKPVSKSQNSSSASNVSKSTSNATQSSSSTISKPPAKSTSRQQSSAAPPRKNPIKPKSSATVASKPPPTATKMATTRAVANNKKKSIFSPENSSASDTESKLQKKSATASTSVRITRSSASSATSTSTSSSSSSDDEDESSGNSSSRPSSISPSIKRKRLKPTPTTASTNKKVAPPTAPLTTTTTNSHAAPGSATATKVGSDSDSRGGGGGPRTSSSTRNTPTVRKLTRSASVRRSKHIHGKRNQCSDTDSDSEQQQRKRSQTRSPVKRSTAKNSSNSGGTNKVQPQSNVKFKSCGGADQKLVAAVAPHEELPRKCPLEGCNSVGHLSGRFERHFTLDACPLYHNLTVQKCRDELSDRKRREELRRKSLDMLKRTPKQQAQLEQKQYLQKVRDLHSKQQVEMSPPSPMMTATSNTINPSAATATTVLNRSREPDLQNFVPDYDLKLFRDAQAIASEHIEEELGQQPNTRGTRCVEMGRNEMAVWYQSPYPEEYAQLGKLYVCEFCLRYMKTHTTLKRHSVKCVWRHPPGEEVYRKEKISVWEVDGKRYKQYCQNLCLLAKFFLDHKTLYYDVEPFLFYVMTLVDTEGCHTVGYFSKEKNSFLNYNVSCILTLPPYQRQGYGRLLIDFSYLLTRVEGKIGSPEKPLSDLGLISYRSYWKDVLLGYLCSGPTGQLSVKDISQEMAIHSYDIVSTLQALGMMKYWKGKHIILKKQDVLEEYQEKVKKKGNLLKQVDPSYLRWTPPKPHNSVGGKT